MPAIVCRDPICGHDAFNHLLIKKINSANAGPAGSKCFILGCKCQRYAGPKEVAGAKKPA